MWYMDVPWLLHGLHGSDTEVGFTRGVAGALQRCYRGGTWMLQTFLGVL